MLKHSERPSYLEITSFVFTTDPTALADKVNAVKKYIADITKVAEVSVQS